MLIGLISDTHIPDHARELPEQLKRAFRDVDLILHAGDIYTTSVLDELERLAPVLAAAGDDDPRITASDRRVKPKHILNIEGVTIWLTHIGPLFQSERLKQEEPPDVDIIVFGHTHEASVVFGVVFSDTDVEAWVKKDVIQINPGSPTFHHYRKELGTVGLLTIDSGKIEARIIQL
ncbi:MAG: YfcE family phosphodiesterase [Chloroflexi bacterium]|nr:YfcE family phosphodiesterase [Chloroflexota bacterium]